MTLPLRPARRREPCRGCSRRPIADGRRAVRRRRRRSAAEARTRSTLRAGWRWLDARHARRGGRAPLRVGDHRAGGRANGAGSGRHGRPVAAPDYRPPRSRGARHGGAGTCAVRGREAGRARRGRAPPARPADSSRWLRPRSSPARSGPATTRWAPAGRRDVRVLCCHSVSDLAQPRQQGLRGADLGRFEEQADPHVLLDVVHLHAPAGIPLGMAPNEGPAQPYQFFAGPRVAISPCDEQSGCTHGTIERCGDVAAAWHLHLPSGICLLLTTTGRRCDDR